MTPQERRIIGFLSKRIKSTGHFAPDLDVAKSTQINATCPATLAGLAVAAQFSLRRCTELVINNIVKSLSGLQSAISNACRE